MEKLNQFNICGYDGQEWKQKETQRTTNKEEDTAGSKHANPGSKFSGAALSVFRRASATAKATSTSIQKVAVDLSAAPVRP